MTFTKIAAMTMLLVWPVAMYYGFQLYGGIHVMLAAALFMWFLQANPMDTKPAVKRTGPRQIG
jgi:F0F1-type ATP synthase assembly protein I